MVVFHDVVKDGGLVLTASNTSATLQGLLAQRLAQGTHNPWVLGSNPGGPTRFFNRPGNLSGLFSFSSQWFSLTNSLPTHLRAPSVGCLRCRRHETGPSTTFNPDPSTIPCISRKPQAVYLRFYFCPRRHGRGMSPKRSRWAGFVAGIPGATGVKPDRRAAAPPARGARPAGNFGHRVSLRPRARFTRRRIFSKIVLASAVEFPYSTSSHGGVAQLGERLTGSQEVRGSIPLVSTRALNEAPT